MLPKQDTPKKGKEERSQEGRKERKGKKEKTGRQEGRLASLVV